MKKNLVYLSLETILIMIFMLVFNELTIYSMYFDLMKRNYIYQETKNYFFIIITEPF
jgi:hypothetical protein